MLSIHALAAGVHEVLSTLLLKTGRGSGFLRDFDRIRPERLAEYKSHMTRTQNFLKHANQDPDHVLDYYKEATPFLIFDAVTMYSTLAGALKVRAFAIFLSWFILENPSLLKEGTVLDYVKDFARNGPFDKDHFRKMLKNPDSYPIPGLQ